MPKEKSNSFEKWTQQELKKVFQLVFVPQQAELQHWLDLVLPANLELAETETVIIAGSPNRNHQILSES